MIMQACHGQLSISLGKTARFIELDMAKIDIQLNETRRFKISILVIQKLR